MAGRVSIGIQDYEKLIRNNSYQTCKQSELKDAFHIC